MSHRDTLDERAIDVIASRVVRALKEELAELAAGLAERSVMESVLTVDDVAERFRVSPSTVYAHWREWGGYKLGTGDKSAIRFRPSSLPARPSTASQATRTSDARPARSRRGRRTRAVLRGEPRLANELDGNLAVPGGATGDRANSGQRFDAGDA